MVMFQRLNHLSESENGDGRESRLGNEVARLNSSNFANRKDDGSRWDGRGGMDCHINIALVHPGVHAPQR